MGENYLKINEVAKLTGLSEQCLRNWDNNGRFKCHHRSEKGNYRYYTIEQVDEYLEKAKRQVKVIGYCRAPELLSDDIRRQESVLLSYVSNRDIDLDNFIILSDISNGVGVDSPNLNLIISDISDNLVKEIIVEDKTRLSVTAFTLIELLAKSHNCKVTVLKDVCRVSKKEVAVDYVEFLKQLKESKGLSKEDLKVLLNSDVIDKI